MAILSSKKSGPATLLASKDANGLYVCPICQKHAAESFMWHVSDTVSMCLACYHTAPKKNGRVHVDSIVKSGSASGEMTTKVVVAFLTFAVVFVGGICLFYRPSMSAGSAKLAGAGLKPGASPAGGAKAGPKPGAASAATAASSKAGAAGGAGGAKKPTDQLAKSGAASASKAPGTTASTTPVGTPKPISTDKVAALIAAHAKAGATPTPPPGGAKPDALTTALAAAASASATPQPGSDPTKNPVAAKAAAKPLEPGAKAGDSKTADTKAAGSKPGDAKPGENKQSESKPDDAKPDKSLVAITKTDADGITTQKMAPTVQALLTQVPKGPVKITAGPPSGVTKLVLEKATDVLTGAPSGPAAPPSQLNPNDKTKDKVMKTKDAVISVAGALVNSGDPDGKKAAAALAKVGHISTTFADVATQLSGDAPKPLNPGAGSGKPSRGGKLEADVLEAQGRGGYDVMEMMEREADQDQTTVKMTVDPRAPKPKAGGPAVETRSLALESTPPDVPRKISEEKAKMAAILKPRVLQEPVNLALEDLPAAFTSAAQGRGGSYVAVGLPATPSLAKNVGKMSAVVMSLRGDLLFTSGSLRLGKEAEGALRELVSALAAHPDVPLLVRGYTDNKGKPEVNIALSKKRAEAVRDWLVAKAKFDPKNVTVQGLGSVDPAQPNEKPDGSDNPTGREKNRRVTVTIPQTAAHEIQEANGNAEPKPAGAPEKS
jgi:outer membrane protein OmpA-like peptidoglycan-associated protein